MQGYEAEAVSNKTEALQRASNFNPWLVILDPLLNNQPVGLELCQMIKSNPSSCRVIVLSSLQERDKALDAGADLYLPKPFELISLLTWIKQSVEEMRFLGGCLPLETATQV